MQPTLLEQLAAWLDNRVYDVGVLLYQQIHGDGFMLSMLKGGADDYNRKKLTDALQTHHDQLSAAETALVESYPESLTGDLERGKILMDERTALKERMRYMADQGITKGEDLKRLAYRVLTIRDDLGTIYGRKEFFRQHGYMPDAPAVDPAITEAALMKRLLSVRTYISKETRRLAQLTADDPKRPKYEQKLRAFTSEAEQLKQQLATLTNNPYDNVTILD
ncbi:hypothetical protein [Spirosoma rhododendri]|uniref:Uncharacterized protein n=1 Tax=Spirosoma rhododendri TaxID=2728024 RepID=A0A7L5DQM7_9BACT|nr:hypothetical protein [Spirosoma rhododendri]QJD79533.1 hypothetical protein HH216_14775 [Spirosoma rhododendri]